MAEKKKYPIGRPPIHGETMERHVIFVTNEQWVYVMERGGGAFVRQLIEQDRRTPPPKKGRPRKDQRKPE